MDFLVVEYQRPEVLLYFTAAFIMNFSPALKTIDYMEDLTTFMNRQNSASIKHLVKRTYWILENFNNGLPVTFHSTKLLKNEPYPDFPNQPLYI
jgi:hypothetical protein